MNLFKYIKTVKNCLVVTYVTSFLQLQFLEL